MINSTKKIKNLLVLCLAFINFNSCGLFNYGLEENLYRKPTVEERAKEIVCLQNESNLMSIKNDEEYDVLIIADLHFGLENKKKNGPRKESEWFKQLLEINESSGKRIIDNVRFAICLGDIADHGYADEFEKYNSLVVQKLKGISTNKAPDGIKIYNVVGNHDLYNSGWNLWCETAYPGTSFFKFETPSFSWYFLDSASGTLGKPQMDALKSTVGKDSKPKILFTHIPIYAENFSYLVMQNTEERNKLINICAQNNASLFMDGHTHKESSSDLGNFTEYTLPGFLEKYGYGILHVNEAEKTLSFSINYYNK